MIAELVSWTKGFDAPGVVGEDVVKLLQQAFDRKVSYDGQCTSTDEIVTSH